MFKKISSLLLFSILVIFTACEKEALISEVDGARELASPPVIGGGSGCTLPTNVEGTIVYDPYINSFAYVPNPNFFGFHDNENPNIVLEVFTDVNCNGQVDPGEENQYNFSNCVSPSIPMGSCSDYTVEVIFTLNYRGTRFNSGQIDVISLTLSSGGSASPSIGYGSIVDSPCAATVICEDGSPFPITIGGGGPGGTSHLAVTP